MAGTRASAIVPDGKRPRPCSVSSARGFREAAAATDLTARLLSSVPADFTRWSHLAQDQYLETRTLLTGYLLSSQGDRMLMAHSVEGRFPFLDHRLVELANSLPPSYKLRGLEEKLVLKRVAADLVPRQVLERPKQPYRAPDAQVFVGAGAPSWVADLLFVRRSSRRGSSTRRRCRACGASARPSPMAAPSRMRITWRSSGRSPRA